MDVEIREDATYVYVDCFDAEPNSELFIEIRSKATPPNTSTTGMTVALHRTVSATGTATFRVIKEALFDDFPRVLTVIGPIASETFTA